MRHTYFYDDFIVYDFKNKKSKLDKIVYMFKLVPFSY